jgi:hypothetical protein
MLRIVGCAHIAASDPGCGAAPTIRPNGATSNWLSGRGQDRAFRRGARRFGLGAAAWGGCDPTQGLAVAPHAVCKVAVFIGSILSCSRPSCRYHAELACDGPWPEIRAEKRHPDTHLQWHNFERAPLVVVRRNQTMPRLRRRRNERIPTRLLFRAWHRNRRPECDRDCQIIRQSGQRLIRSGRQRDANPAALRVAECEISRPGPMNRDRFLPALPCSGLRGGGVPFRLPRPLLRPGRVRVLALKNQSVGLKMQGGNRSCEGLLGSCSQR